MDETLTDSGSTPEFNWHVSNDVLLEMTQEQRDAYLNEKTSRLYDALTALVAGEGQTTSKQIDIILNPESHPDIQ